MALFTKNTKLDIKVDMKTAIQSIKDPEKLREWNPQTLVRQKDESIDWNKISENKIVNILTINEEFGDHSKHIIKGTVEKLTTGQKQDDVKMEFKEQVTKEKKWTQLITNIDPSLIRLGLTVSGGLAILKLLDSTTLNVPQVYAATTTPIMSSGASTTSVGLSTTATSASLLSTKTALTSVIAVMLVTSGVYVAEPELFGLNQNMNHISESLKSDISFNKIYDTNTISQNSLSSSGSNSKSISSGMSSSASLSGVSASQSVSRSQNTNTESISVQTESTDGTNAISNSGSSGASSKVSIDSGIAPLIRDTISRNFDNPSSAIFVEDIKSRGITFDSKNNLYAVDQDNHSIRVYDPDGNLINDIGKRSITPVSFEAPRFDGTSKLSSLFVQYAYAVENSLYCEISTGVGCTDPDGIGPLELGDGQFYSPYGIAIDSKDNLYVADSKNHRIQIFDSAGNFITKFGEYGKGDGQFNYPYGITIDSNGNLYVADSGNDRIQIFDSAGNFITKFGEYGKGDGQFVNPRGITIDSNGNLYVADRINHRIQIFDSAGNFITKFGEYGKGDGQFNSTYGITIDSNGNLYVADSGNDRIQKISFEKAIMTFSEQFDEIKCDAGSMIENPISIPLEIVTALPVSELLSRANSLAFDTQQYQEGLLFYYLISQIESTNVNAWNGIGYTQTQVCDNNSAEIAYAQSLMIDPDNINAKIGLADFTINQVIREGNSSILKLEDAEVQLQSVLELEPGNTNTLNALGYIETLRENYDDAINYYEQSRDIDDKITTTLNGLAFAHLRSGDLGEATTTYLKVTSIDPNNFDALVGLITAYTQQGFLGSAEQFIDRLDESNNIAANKLIEQGNWLQQNGQTEEAQRLFDAAKKLKK